jgi:4-amino-4-deoxy-L-arabinose transferase-like glycosyltransferase
MSSSPAPAAARAGAATRRSLLPLVVALAALMLSMLLAAAYPLLDPDEGRNAEIAREMAGGSGLLVPHLAGMPYLDKPPALFWMAAIAVRAVGDVPWAVRMPAAVAAALTLALLAHHAQRRGGRAFALRAAALLFTAPLFAVLSAYVLFDMPLTLCVTAVWLGLAAELTGGARARRRLWMFAAVTAGVLLKGPVMLAWAVGGSLGAALLCRRPGSAGWPAPLRWLGWWPGWAIVLGVAGGWFALASAHHPEYPRYAFLEESFQRLTSGSFRREQPWWFVPAVLAAGALPWSLATPWWRRRTPGEEPLLSVESRVGLGFVLFAVVFFSFSHSKLVTYLLPVLPMLAWTAAEAWSDAGRVHRAAWGLAIVFALLALVCGLAGFGPWLARAAPPLPGAVFGARIVAGCFGYIAIRSMASAFGRPDRAFLGVVLFTPVLLFGAGEPLLRYAASQSGEPLARAIEATAPGARVRYLGCYSPGTDFLLGRRSELVSVTGQETTSNYQARYRATLIERHQWTPLAAEPDTGRVEVLVQPAGRSAVSPPQYIPFFHDDRFAAYVRR